MPFSSRAVLNKYLSSAFDFSIILGHAYIANDFDLRVDLRVVSLLKSIVKVTLEFSFSNFDFDDPFIISYIRFVFHAFIKN